MAAAVNNPAESTRRNVLTLLANSHKSTRALTAALCAGHILSCNATCREWLAMTPAYVFGSFNVWTIATAAFLETKLANLFVDICLLLYIGSVAMPLWGQLEFVKFVAVAVLAGNMAALFAVVLDFGLSGDDTILFHQYGGFGGVVGAFTVVLWQLSPEAKVYLFFTWPLRCRQLPVLLVVVAFVSVPLGSPVYFVGLTCAGIFWSWFYLRFYQKIDNVRGDLSRSFAFASIFPERIQPLMTSISDKVYHVARKTRAIPPPLEGFSALGDGVGSNDQERQRQRALAALNSRMLQQ